MEAKDSQLVFSVFYTIKISDLIISTGLQAYESYMEACSDSRCLMQEYKSPKILRAHVKFPQE